MSTEAIRDAIQDVLFFGLAEPHSRDSSDAISALIAALKRGRQDHPEIVTAEWAAATDQAAYRLRDAVTTGDTPKLEAAGLDLQARQAYLRECGLYGGPVTETGDENVEEGLVAKNPPEGYVPLSSVLDKVDGNYMTAKRIIEVVGIATWKPTPTARRLYVNAAEWLNHFEQNKPSDEAIEKFIQGTEDRKAGIPKNPNRKPKQLPQ